jgi:hypothetical protein
VSLILIAITITATNSLDLATISAAAQSTPKSNNISAVNSVTIGDNVSTMVLLQITDH